MTPPLVNVLVIVVPLRQRRRIKIAAAVKSCTNTVYEVRERDTIKLFVSTASLTALIKSHFLVPINSLQNSKVNVFCMQLHVVHYAIVNLN